QYKYKWYPLPARRGEELGAGVSLLLRRFKRDVWQGRRGTAERADPVPSTLDVRNQQSRRLRAHPELSGSVSDARLERHPLQPRIAAARVRIRDPQDNFRSGAYCGG